jgi:hypothetical protein
MDRDYDGRFDSPTARDKGVVHSFMSEFNSHVTGMLKLITRRPHVRACRSLQDCVGACIVTQYKYALAAPLPGPGASKISLPPSQAPGRPVHAPGDRTRPCMQQGHERVENDGGARAHRCHGRLLSTLALAPAATSVARDQKRHHHSRPRVSRTLPKPPRPVSDLPRRDAPIDPCRLP